MFLYYFTPYYAIQMHSDILESPTSIPVRAARILDLPVINLYVKSCGITYLFIYENVTVSIYQWQEKDDTVGVIHRKQ